MVDHLRRAVRWWMADGGYVAYGAEVVILEGATAVGKVALPAAGVDGFSL